jgi:hypothetical protein
MTCDDAELNESKERTNAVRFGEAVMTLRAAEVLRVPWRGLPAPQHESKQWKTIMSLAIMGACRRQ